MDGLDLCFHDAYRKQRVHFYHKNKKVSPKTQYNESTIIRCFVNFALSRGMLTHDPLKGLKLKKPKPTPQPCWTYEQVQSIRKRPVKSRPCVVG